MDYETALEIIKNDPAYVKSVDLFSESIKTPIISPKDEKVVLDLLWQTMALCYLEGYKYRDLVQ